MKQSVPFLITEENFPKNWDSIDCLRRKSRRMSAIARIGGFWSNLTLLFSLLVTVNGLIYENFHGLYHAFLDSLPVFPELWAAVTSFALQPGDALNTAAGKLLLLSYSVSAAVFIVIALLIALIYHPFRKPLPEGTYTQKLSLLSKAAQEAWSQSYRTKISTSIASTLLVIVAAFVLIFAYVGYYQDPEIIIELLAVFPTPDPSTNSLLYVLAAYLICNFFCTILLLLTRPLYRYQFPYDLMAQAEAAVLFAQEDTEDRTPEEIAALRAERAAALRSEALDLEREAAYQKAKNMLHDAALLGDLPAMEHYARHCILSHLNDSAMYWLKKCIATGYASKEAEKMLLRLRLHLNHRVAYLRSEAAPLTKKQKILRVLKITITVIWRILILAVLLAVIALAALLADNNFDLSVFQDLPGAFSQLFS